MSGSELDLPVLVSADQIRRRQFVTTRRGYEPEHVREFLERVALRVEQMETLIREARLQADSALRASAEPRVDPYEQLSARFAEVIRSVDEAAERVRREGREDAERMLSEARADAERMLPEARADAERMLSEARADADRIRTDAQAKAEEARASADRALREARDQADRTIAGLSTRREALVRQLAQMQAQMQAQLLGMTEQLDSAIAIRNEVDADLDPDVIGEGEAREELFSVPGADGAASARPDTNPTVVPPEEEL